MSERDELENLAIIKQALLDRRADDPLFNFQPHVKQRPFLDAVLSGSNGCSENWFIAANRSGKSDAGGFCGAALSRFGQDPRDYSRARGSGVEIKDRATSGWVVSQDFPASRDIIQPKYFDNGFVPAGALAPFIPQREISEWRGSDQILKLKNGSIIGFKSCDSGSKKFQGAGKDWIHFDEEPDKLVYDECGIRVEAGRELRIFGTCTILPPENKVGGVSWLFPEIIQKFLDGRTKTIGVFGASIYDNPHIPREEIAKLESKYPPESPEGRIRLGGEWLPGIGGARAYPPFDRRLHVKPQPYPISRRPLCWIWDFNVEPLISTVGQYDGLLFRFMRELVMEEGSIPEMCELFVDAYPQHYGEIWVYGDATGTERSAQSRLSDYRIIQNTMRRYSSPLRLKVPESNPFVSHRINAVNMALKDEHGNTSVEVDPCCIELIADFEQVLRDNKGGIKKTFNKKDPYYRRTHASDGAGYWIVKERPVRNVVDLNQYRAGRVPTPSYGFTG